MHVRNVSSSLLTESIDGRILDLMTITNVLESNESRHIQSCASKMKWQHSSFFHQAYKNQCIMVSTC
jgi:hypothetical protein